MRLPIIKHVLSFIEENDEDWVNETIELLESMTEIPSLKDEEVEVMGELLSNLYGTLEVQRMIKDGMDRKEAMNAFMQRVMGSIDK
ncbi:DUF6952 family protein [Anditalea andensis]|uniref:Uncharacterized protein n=1 Tax=Anditalea andensis TaxID=1048983 RepID=A0A074KU52_9BACT|nr:hypothetical protein [Anditalea andensis]KEO73511.1 hypothetical protein EL17_11435 [Anditalea andensis]